MNKARLVILRPLLATGSLLLAMLSGCAMPEEVKPPAQLLPKEKLVSLLVQLHLLEARVESSHLTADSARALFQSQKKQLLWRNNVVAADSMLEHSYRYYAINHKDMEEIYKEVIDSLQHREAALDTSKSKTSEHPW